MHTVSMEEYFEFSVYLTTLVNCLVYVASKQQDDM